MRPTRVVQGSNVTLRLRKTYTKPKMTSHTVLTDDAFSYVDFYFKKHPKKLKDKNGKEIKQNYIFYWEQAYNFYRASKILPVESAPLPMYYSMLNAIKAYILYHADDIDKVISNFNRHGLGEQHNSESDKKNLDEIFVYRCDGVFSIFSKMIDTDIDKHWGKNRSNPMSVKQLLSNLVFIYNSYIATYDLKRKDEEFIPLEAGSVPSFMYCSDKKVHLVAKIEKSYFKSDATVVPEDLAKNLKNHFDFSENDPFCLISKKTFKKSEIKIACDEFRDLFDFISSEKKLWYIDEKAIIGEKTIPSILAIVAITHRMSEIVRYKPEEMRRLLSSKENWLIHEFLSLALDQFVDEITCEITKHDIMKTRYK